MRIIHTIPAISEEASGPSYSVIRLCESIIAENSEITLCTIDRSAVLSIAPFLKTFPITFGLRRIGFSTEMKRWLFELAASNRMDLVHNHSLWMMPNVYPGMVARRHKVPYVVSPRGTLSEWAMKHGSAAKKVFWPVLQKPSFKNVSCFHATAWSEYQDIRRMGFQQPVAIIPNGVDIPDLVPRAESDFRTLLFLSRIHPKKGLDILFEAWREVQANFNNWRLKIVGPDSQGYLALVKKLALDLGLVRVEFSGPLYGADKILAYQQADLYVLPTYSENFGMSVAEALAAGTPAIVTKGAPWEDLVSQGCGWWVDVSVDALVTCLEDSLSRSNNELKEMGLRGRKWMEAEYCWSKIGRQMTQTYKWIVHGGPKPTWVILD